MKKIFTLLLVLFSLVAGAQTLALKQGSVLTYLVNADGKTYNFIITIKNWGDDRVFDYEMTAPVTQNGNVTILASALNSASGQTNRFAGGAISLSDRTTVWLSKTVFDGLKKDFQARISCDGEAPVTLLNNFEDIYPVKVDGKEARLTVIYAEEQSGKPYKYWILNDSANPLILKMDLGWTIQLTDVKL